MTIELLPGARLSPQVLLHNILEDIDTTRGVMVVVLDDEDLMQVSWSNMPVAYLAMAAMLVDAKVRQAVVESQHLL